MKVALRKVLDEVDPLLGWLLVGGGRTDQILAAASRAREAVEAGRKVLEPGAVTPPTQSERGLAFADWFRSTLAADVRLPSRWREHWARCFDEMLRLDERTPEQIAAVCRWARAHDFWKANFQTPLKLRHRKDGLMYFDRFAAAMKGAPSSRRPAQSRGYEIASGRGPKAVSALDLLKGESR